MRAPSLVVGIGFGFLMLELAFALLSGSQRRRCSRRYRRIS